MGTKMTLTPYAQKAHLNKQIGFIPLYVAEKLLADKSRVIFKRQCYATDVKIDNELRLIEIKKCLPILEELENESK